MHERMTGEESNIYIKKERIWTKDFVLICLANFFIFLGFQMTLPTLPLYVEHLGGSDQLIGFIVGIFTFSALLIRPYAGHALETKGRKLVYLTGLAIFALAVVTFGFLESIFLLFAMRIVQGIGWGFSTTASGTIATDLIPAKRRGEGMGYYGLSGNIALAFGPSLGLLLAVVVPFNMLFGICAFFGLAALLLSAKIQFKKTNLPKAKAVGVKWDFCEKSALKPSVLLFFITVTFGGIASFLPLYTAEKGISGIQIYFLFYALALMVTRTYAGMLYDKKGHRAVFIPGAVLIAAGMLFLSWLPNSLVLYSAAVLYGLGFGMVQPALQAWSIEKAPANRKGMATATFYSFFDLGVGIGAIVFGQIGHLFGYQSIYIAASLSVFISMAVYVLFLFQEGKQRAVSR